MANTSNVSCYLELKEIHWQYSITAQYFVSEFGAWHLLYLKKSIFKFYFSARSDPVVRKIILFRNTILSYLLIRRRKWNNKILCTSLSRIEETANRLLFALEITRNFSSLNSIKMTQVEKNLPRSNTHARKRPFTALNGDIRRS